MVHPSRKSKIKRTVTPMVMKVRETRLPEIIDIISHHTIRSQEELSKQLAVRGFIITQATLSRDLKLIKATKLPDENGICRYVVGQLPASASGKASSSPRAQTSAHAPHTPHSAILSMGMTGNLLVIKTRNGYASGVAYEIDLLESRQILGTISGADTVFVALAHGVTIVDIKKLLAELVSQSLLDTLE